MSSLWENLTIIITSDVLEYRRKIRELISKDDHVLEIGCASGKTTKILAEICAKVYAIDKSLPEVNRAKNILSKYENAFVECLDAFDIKSILSRVRENLGGKVDVILIDIGGLEDPGKVISLLWRYLHIFKPRLIIVKNALLKRIAKAIKI